MTEKNKITFEILESGQVKSTLMSEDGLKQVKMNSFQEFINAASQQEINLPILPFGTISFYRSKTHDHYLLYLPPFTKNAKYKDNNGSKEYKDLIFPPTIFYVLSDIWTGRKDKDLVNKYASSARIFALGGPLLTMEDKLYAYPYSNTYENGGICWGTVNNANLRAYIANTPLQIENLPQIFLNSEWNDHVQRETKARMDYVSEKKEIPLKYLANSTHTTISSFWNCMTNK